MVIGTISRCTMGRLKLVESAPPPCRGWTWRLCPLGSVHGRTDREPETSESESPQELTEVAPPRGKTGVTVRLFEVDVAAGALEDLDLDLDRAPGEEDQHPEDCRGGVSGAGSPPLCLSRPCWSPPTDLRPSPDPETPQDKLSVM